METTETQPQKGRQIVKIVAVLALVILFAGAIGYFVYGNINTESRPSLKMTITTELNETTELPIITNVTFEQSTVPFYYVKADTPPKFPDITVETKIGAVKNPPAGYRVGAFRPVEGTYNLTVTFMNGSEPKTGDLLILAIRLSDFRGVIIKKTTAFYDWK